VSVVPASQVPHAVEIAWLVDKTQRQLAQGVDSSSGAFRVRYSPDL